MAVRTSNPALRANTFTGFSTTSVTSSNTMTLQGTVDKTILLLVALVAAAAVNWGLFLQHSPLVVPLLIGGFIGEVILAIIVIFNQSMAPILSPFYAICEGLVLGGISAMFELRYPGIVMQAVGCTFGTLFCMLAAYRSGLVKATENFKLGVIAATGGICVFYFVSMLAGLFMHVQLLNSTGPVGIVISLVVVVVAALNLVLDFDFIETGVEAGAPRYMEWYAAFSLLLTLIWLYLEFLRLMAKLRDR